MEYRPKHIGEVLDELMADLAKGPYVYREDGAYVFLADRDRPDQIYDITDYACRDAGDALGWIAHMAEKTWVTNEHIEQFAVLAMQQFGIRRR